MENELSVSKAIEYRRSVRVFDAEKSLNNQTVKDCIQQAVLAPNSSNLQLWEFYHITDTTTLEKIAPLCFNQNAAKTAKQLVVVVVRKDLWKQRANANLGFIDSVFGENSPGKDRSSREKVARNYYGKLIPFAYREFLGLFGLLRYLLVLVMGLFRPIYREVRKSDMRIVAHKSAGLAAQTFMLSMAAYGYDTCPMEGSDTWRVKGVLGLPIQSEINMIIGCGIRSEKGVYGDRFRVPFSEVYHHV